MDDLLFKDTKDLGKGGYARVRMAQVKGETVAVKIVIPIDYMVD